ncbi:MAG TPA: VOC family protein [Solirubrobacterales bacterium]|nr:VOC family protein [Solirubrobacterales bacterium]
MTDLSLNGVHHISCITGDAPGNVEFYAGLLGMRLVKKTVNQDDPSVYHLFYGDEKGTPGFDLTFFEYPGARQGRAGEGMIHRILWRVDSSQSLDFWAGRLEDAGIETVRSSDEGAGFYGVGPTGDGDTLMFQDPEGLTHELLVYQGPDKALIPGHAEVPAEHAIQGFHGARAFSANRDVTEQVLGMVLGFDDEGNGHWQLTGEAGEGFEARSGTYILDEAPGERALQGSGTVHHIAWSSSLEQHADWRKEIAATGLYITPVIDRFYFKALYFREPGGVLFELATIGPGFTTDEDLEHLGERLSLPPDFEPVRDQVEPNLRPIPDVTQWRPDSN